MRWRANELAHRRDGQERLVELMVSHGAPRNS